MAILVGLQPWSTTFRRDCKLLAAGLLSCVAGVAGCGSSSQAGPPSPAQVQVTVGGTGQVRLGSTAQLTVTVTNTLDAAVTWQVNGITGGSSAVGTISAAGLYTPPATIPATNPVTITAVSVASPAASGSASESVWNPVPSVTTATVAQNYGATTGLMTVSGTGFVAGSQVQAAGAGAATTFVSATELQATVPVGAGADRSCGGRG